jgi:sugar lactone lactonase YvrE
MAAGVDQPGSVVRVMAVDGRTRQVTDTDLDPAFAATSSGDRIYVASGLDQDGVLATIDADTGEKISEVTFTDRWRNTLPAYFDTMTISPDDRWLFALSFQSAGAERDGYYLRIFDLARGQFLPEIVQLSCVGGLALPGRGDLVIACPHSGVILTTRIGATGDVGVIASTEISQSGIAGAARLPASQGTLVLTKEGNIVQLDNQGLRLLFATEGALPPAFDGLGVSPDGKTIYVARGTTSGGMIGSIEAYDLTGKLLASSNLDEVAWTMSISNDGTRLLLPAHGARAILVLDANTLQPVGRSEVPGAPVQVIEP